MTETELAYIAGFFDGEGSINIRRRKRSGRTNYSLSISMTQTNELVLCEMADILEVGSVRKMKTHKSKKDAWRWDAGNGAAYKVLLKILPYLRVKNLEAEHALRFHNWKICNIPKGTAATEEQTARMEEMKLQLQDMR